MSTLNFSRVEITCVLHRDAKGNYEAESVIPLVCFGKAQVSSTLWCWCVPQKGLKRPRVPGRTLAWFETRGVCSGARGKEPACRRRRHRRCGSNPWVGRFPWRGKWQPTPVLLLENPPDRGAWRLRCVGSQSQTRLSEHTRSVCLGCDTWPT